MRRLPGSAWLLLLKLLACDASTPSEMAPDDSGLGAADLGSSDSSVLPLFDALGRDGLIPLDPPDVGSRADADPSDLSFDGGEDQGGFTQDSGTPNDVGLVPVTPSECMSLHPLVDGERRYCDPGNCYCGINEDGCIRDDVAPSCCAMLGLCCNQTCY